MKRLFTVLLCTLFLFSCSDDDGQIELQNADLIGTWETAPANSDADTENILVYSFRLSGQFETYRIVRDKDDATVLGYTYYAKGDYTIVDNDLSFAYTEAYDLENGSEATYVAKEDLITVENPASFTVDYSVIIENENTSLVYDFGPCEDASNCVDELTFIKVD